jgi:uncharacterized membrane protein
MNEKMAMLGGVGLGAGLMYLLDPSLGRRRRARLRDQAVRLSHDTTQAARVFARDFGQRSYGLMAETKSRFSANGGGDEVIRERVRSKLGRVVSHPHALDVSVRNGEVTLSGPVLADEASALLSCVSSVPGVTSVRNQTLVFRRAEDVPDLQGGRKRPGESFDFMQARWSPTTRLFAATAGGALVAFGLTRRFPVACIAGTAGLGLLARALTNMEVRRLIGVGAGRRAVEVHKTIRIDAPIEQVFEFWTHYGNFGHFMSHLREVRDLGDGRSRWVAAGPGGMSMTWNAVITRVTPFEMIAWKSEPGSTIANAGVVRFEPISDWSTRVDIHLSYNPPAGALGHLAALLFGADPKSAMDEDLVRLKSLLEEGKTSAPGKKLTREDLGDSGLRSASWPAL